MEFLYRAMVKENDLPKPGASATKLGVRRCKDIEVDEDGNVHRPEFRVGERNGISCAPSVSDLPDFALPTEWGGTNRKTTVWRIAVDDLPADLTAEQDGLRHISIGPAHTMSFEDFSEVIQSTSSRWEIVVPSGSKTHDT
jgi:hypothetical protein